MEMGFVEKQISDTLWDFFFRSCQVNSKKKEKKGANCSSFAAAFASNTPQQAITDSSANTGNILSPECIIVEKKKKNPDKQLKKHDQYGAFWE